MKVTKLNQIVDDIICNIYGKYQKAQITPELKKHIISSIAKYNDVTDDVVEGLISSWFRICDIADKDILIDVVNTKLKKYGYID